MCLNLSSLNHVIINTHNRLCCVHFLYVATFTIVLGSFESISLSYDGSGTSVLTVCAGDLIMLTCHHDNQETGITRWIFSPPVDCAEIIDHSNPTSTDPCDPFTFQNITELTPTTTLLNSTAVARAKGSLSGTVIECRDNGGMAYNQIGNVTLCVIGMMVQLMQHMTCKLLRVVIIL